MRTVRLTWKPKRRLAAERQRREQAEAMTLDAYDKAKAMRTELFSARAAIKLKDQALDCAHYALTHKDSNQDFAINACRDAHDTKVGQMSERQRKPAVTVEMFAEERRLHGITQKSLENTRDLLAAERQRRERAELFQRKDEAEANELSEKLMTERQRREQAEQSLKRLQSAVMHGQRWSEALDENDKLRQELADAQADNKRLKEQWDSTNQDLQNTKQRELSALAAIAKHNARVTNIHDTIMVDLSALHKHDDEVRKPLVDALESIAANTCCDKCQEAALVAKSALAKVKEGK